MYFKEMIFESRNRIRVMIGGEGLPRQSFMGEEGKMHKNDIESKMVPLEKLIKAVCKDLPRFFFFLLCETQLMSTSPACSENYFRWFVQSPGWWSRLLMLPPSSITRVGEAAPWGPSWAGKITMQCWQD